MSMNLFAADALTPEGWRRDVRIDIDVDGTIAAVRPDADRNGAECAAGPLIPGMPNLHSHAFQRAIAGRTGHAGAEGDSFWTWRQAMYAFLDRVDADAFEAIAAQAYVEMLKAGYTSVAEFHYVHHDPRGKSYANPAELAQRIVAATRESGIALTLLPVFYAHAGFGGLPATEGQRRFVHSVETYARLVDALKSDAAAAGWSLGVAPHSLRAVTPDELSAVLTLAPNGAPIHLHAAEQTKEVDDCVAWSGARPIEWLLDHAKVDARWCVVHATHMTAEETRRLALSGAVAGLAPTTEADLGDGTFAARAYLDAGGAIGVGSDSNTIIDPYAELRQLEWSQRLEGRSRNVLARGNAPVGRSLYEVAAQGGARASGRHAGVIATGCRADLVVLDGDDPALAAQRVDALLDAAIFGPCRAPVRDVMVAGIWVVRDGHHPREREVFARYRKATAELSE
ncbi:MAG: formimidoylglutamate deiminase [Betaproteobacteria bacterium]